MSTRIYLAGRIAVEVGGTLIIEEGRFRGGQSRAVFAYLICNRSRPVRKEELAEVLWNEELPPAWDTALSTIINRLRRLLGEVTSANPDSVIVQGFGQY